MTNRILDTVTGDRFLRVVARTLAVLALILLLVNAARAHAQTIEERLTLLEQVTGALNQENTDLAVQLAEADERINQLEARIATLETVAATQRAAIAAFTTLSRPSVAARNQRIARRVLEPRGWHTGRQWVCVRTLWQHESGWDHRARNPKSGAAGIPQALPAPRGDFLTNPATQIRWGGSYIARRYGTPCRALAHSNRRGWYSR